MRNVMRNCSSTSAQHFESALLLKAHAIFDHWREIPDLHSERNDCARTYRAVARHLFRLVLLHICRRTAQTLISWMHLERDMLVEQLRHVSTMHVSSNAYH